MGDELSDILARTALCRDLSPDEVARVAEGGRVEYWPAGSLVLEEGSHGPRMIVLLEGRVQILKHDRAGHEHLLDDVGPGAVLGEMSLLLQQPRSATVRALSPLRVFAMEQSEFQAMIAAEDPAALKMGFSLARTLAGRLDAINRKAVELIDAAEVSGAEVARIADEVAGKWEFDR